LLLGAVLAVLAVAVQAVAVQADTVVL